MSEFNSELLRLIAKLEWSLQKAHTTTLCIDKDDVQLSHDIYEDLWFSAYDAKNFLREQLEALRKLEL